MGYRFIAPGGASLGNGPMWTSPLSADRSAELGGHCGRGRHQARMEDPSRRLPFGTDRGSPGALLRMVFAFEEPAPPAAK